MTDTPIAARPKNVQTVEPPEMYQAGIANPMPIPTPAPERRGPGRPPKPDLFQTLVKISEDLRGVDAEQRVQLLQTLINLSK
jgi:hypothetical protein